MPSATARLWRSHIPLWCDFRMHVLQRRLWIRAKIPSGMKELYNPKGRSTCNVDNALTPRQSRFVLDPAVDAMLRLTVSQCLNAFLTRHLCLLHEESPALFMKSIGQDSMLPELCYTARYHIIEDYLESHWNFACTRW